MKKSIVMFKSILLLVVMMLVGGCASFNMSDPVATGFTYATMQKIDSGSWTSEAVLKEVERIRELAETSVEIDTQDIVNSVLERVGIDDPSERFLAAQFLGGMQSYVLEAEIPEDRFMRLANVLDAVELGARLMQ